MDENVDSSSEKELAKEINCPKQIYIFLCFIYLFRFQIIHLECA